MALSLLICLVDYNMDLRVGKGIYEQIFERKMEIKEKQIKTLCKQIVLKLLNTGCYIIIIYLIPQVVANEYDY